MSPFLPLRVIIPVLLVVSALVASLGGYFYMYTQSMEEVEEESIFEVRQTMNLLQSSVNIMLRRGDVDGIQIQLTSLATNKDNIFAILINKEGKVILSSSKDIEGETLASLDPVLTRQHELSKNSSSVFLSDNRQYVYAIYLVNLPHEQGTLRAVTTGYLVLKKSIASRKLLEKNLTIKHTQIFLLLMAVLSLLMWLAFHFLITSRVGRLLEVTGDVSGGNLAARSGIKGKDEFSRIARALDNMAISLAINQRELITSEERLRLSQEYANIGTWEWNIAANSIYWSEMIPAIFGVQPGDVKTYDDFIAFVHPEDVKNVEEALQRCLNTGEKYNVQHRIIRPDGTQRWIHEQGDVMRSMVDGSPSRMFGVAIDITEQKQAESQLHLQASALEAAADGIAITDTGGCIQWVNSAFTRLTGYEFDEAVGQNQRILNSGKHDKDFFKKLWGTILAKKVWHGEIWNKRKDGSLYLEDESLTPVLDAKGDIEYFIAIKRDISERHKLSQQLRQAQKMEAIGQLTGGIAHDFNNMLASVLGFSEILMSEMAETGNEKGKAYVDQIYNAGCRARDLVAQMLAFSRGSDDELAPFALAPLVRESIAMLGATLPSSIEIKLQLESNNILVLTNPVQIHQMVMNLCINARDAMNGKGVITIAIERVGNVDTECCSCHKKITGEYIRFYVSDTGSGIKSGQIDRLFDPFYSTKEVGKGTGMGLSMVHGIMHSHNGHILVDSKQGKGTTFSLLFPLISSQYKADASVVEYIHEERAHDMSGHVLVVDDEVSFAQYIRVLLEDHGCRVTVANDSQSAMAVFKNNPSEFDLVVTDQTMPRMTGDELASELLAERPDLPIILCTGFSEKVDEDKALALGIKGYIEKPIESEKFLLLCKNLLRSSAVSSGEESLKNEV